MYRNYFVVKGTGMNDDHNKMIYTFKIRTNDKRANGALLVTIIPLLTRPRLSNSSVLKY